MRNSHLFPKPHPQTAGRVIDGEAVLIMADTSEINVLNLVGSRIFELADGSRSLGEISAVITGEFDVKESRAAADVAEFVDELVRRQVLVLSQERAS